MVSVRSLTTEFPTRAGVVRAVDRVSLHLDAGEVLAIVGESGCGKSTTALSMLRLIRHPGRVVGGQVWLNGQDLMRLAEPDLRSVRGGKVGMIFQEPLSYLNPLLSVGRQIAEGLEIHRGLDRKAAMRRAIELLDRVGIPAAQMRVNDYPHQFSGGMRQRVMIAIALSCTPQLLIADEPTTSLDVTIQAQILELLHRLRSDLDMAMILITHDLGVVAGIADRVVVMYAGRVVETGSVFETFQRPVHPYTQALLASLPRVDRPRQKLASIAGGPPTLEDMPMGCQFHPRCSQAIDLCRQQAPNLEAISGSQEAACWVAQGVVAGVPSGTTK